MSDERGVRRDGRRERKELRGCGRLTNIREDMGQTNHTKRKRERRRKQQKEKKAESKATNLPSQLFVPGLTAPDVVFLEIMSKTTGPSTKNWVHTRALGGIRIPKEGPISYSG
jgi:hypothetical protein